MNPVDPSASSHLEVLGVAVACLVPALPAGWKAASLRGDSFNKWAERVDVTHVGLTERAAAELLDLQDRITDALGSSSAAFNPSQAIADPKPLIDGATRCASLLRTRDRLRPRFRRYSRLGSGLLTAVSVYVLSLLVGGLYYAGHLRDQWVRDAAFGAGGLAVGSAILLFCAYAYYENRLAVAEELAQETV
ncbi:MAG TPA: hypothetical protein VJ986_09380 [Gaiellaceae bacterium]|nr:hypothetical protein [Gaiellaceae bacterium]